MYDLSSILLPKVAIDQSTLPEEYIFRSILADLFLP